ncbi:acyl-CoA thioesterase [Halopseudomonas salegens]|uniref:Acyl-CoA thioesterase n=1 Tax=Halopseudomonas salegens TaxID=1434072 RepID=A0A1H2EU26_9GAMM|nr:thioesterase family protein [Halopseudomonas salegens]SDT98549.1 Acyl-CoA thioesterase [Halopseudomonas salegens]
MTFAQLLAALEDSADNTVVIPDDWAQGRAGYGGLVVALIYDAMRRMAGAERPVRSLAITFVGPAQPGEPLQIESQILRQGKAVSQMLGMAKQNGEVACIVQGSFGAGRNSQVDVAAAPAPAAKAPDDCQQMPYIKDVTPEFLKHFDIRLAFGGMPFSNSQAREHGGWMRFKTDEGELHEAHLLGLVDVWPPAVLPLLKQRAPASSLTWTIEFVQPVPALGNTDWLLYKADIEHARDGYGHTAAMIWREDGALIAISRQTIAVFG